MEGQTYRPMDGQEGRHTDRQTDRQIIDIFTVSKRHVGCIQVYPIPARGHKIPSEHSMIKICCIKHNHSHKTAPSGFIDHVTI